MTEPNASKESSRVTSLKEEERDKHVRSEEGSDSDDDSEAGQDEKCAAMDNLTRLKREKRLEMNRRSARERRKRKKMLIETLEQQVAELTRSNEKFKRENQHLVLRVESLADRLAKQEKELALLRSITGKGHDPQLMTHQLSSPSSLATTTPAMLGSLSGLPQGLGYDASDASADVSLRRLLHTESLSRAAAASAAAMGSQQGFSYAGVPPNRAIDQEILSRIGRDPSVQGLYDQMLPSHAARTGLGTSLPGQNAVSLSLCGGMTLVSMCVELTIRRCLLSHSSSAFHHLNPWGLPSPTPGLLFIQGY